MRQFRAAWDRFAADEANLTEFLNMSGSDANVRPDRPSVSLTHDIDNPAVALRASGGPLKKDTLRFRHVDGSA